MRRTDPRHQGGVHRTQIRTAELRQGLYGILADEYPMTVRQVFYQATVSGLVPKTELAYNGSVVRVLKEMRLDRMIPFEWVVDNTRSVQVPATYVNLDEALAEAVKYYSRDRWQTQPDYLQVWIEKDALSAVLYEETSRWQVPLFPVRGMPSISFLHEGAQMIATQDKPAYLYYFGDYDPTGEGIDANIEKRIREFAPDSEIHFKRVAITDRQIDSMELPSRPTKTSDSRTKNWKAKKVAEWQASDPATRPEKPRTESYELDAIPSAALRGLVKDCIEPHIDWKEWNKTAKLEASEEKRYLAKQRKKR